MIGGIRSGAAHVRARLARPAALIGLAALAALPVRAAGHALFVEPDCPKPTESIDLVATPGVGVDVFRWQPISITVAGNVVRMEAEIYSSSYPEPPPSYVRGTLGALPVGAYRFELYTRTRTESGYDAPILAGTRDFQVYDVPPQCGASDMAVVGAGFLKATVNQAYGDRIAVRIVDAHGLPVPNFQVTFERVEATPVFGVARPDIMPHYDVVSTRADGIASFATAANEAPGVFQYRAYFRKAERYVSGYFTLYNAPVASLQPDYPVVEYYNGFLMHYFMTGDPAEMTKLDRSADWQRTGEAFMAFAPPSVPTGTSAVCRFYGLPQAGLDSHFFSASPQECAEVARRFGGAWALETSDAFAVLMPDTTSGACAAGTTPVYRAYNNLPDANHRYATNPAALQSSPYRIPGTGWTREGYGPDAVAMCAPL